MSDDDLDLLLRSLGDHRVQVEVVVDAALYACCGRSWQNREGYEQTYHGYVHTLDLPGPDEPGRARLVSRGAGTISYFVIFGLDRVADVRAL